MTQTDGILQRVFGERKISETDRTILQTWLTGQLSRERAGWKRKLEAAMKATETERRLALATHASVQQIYEMMTETLPLVCRRDENRCPSAEEVDMKTYRLEKIEDMWKTTVGMLAKYQIERNEIVKALNVCDANSSEVDLPGIIQAQLVQISVDNTSDENNLKETLIAVEEDNVSLRKALKELSKSYRELRLKYSRDVGELQKHLHTARETAREVRGGTDVESGLVGDTTQHEKQTTLREWSRQSNGPHGNKGEQTRPSDGIESATIKTESPISQDKQSTFRSHAADASPSTKNLHLPSIGSRNSSIRDESGSKTPDDYIHHRSGKNSTAMKTSNSRSDRHHQGTYFRNQKISSAENPTDNGVSFLRSQVINFAKRLQNAQKEMENCHKELAIIQKTAFKTAGAAGTAPDPCDDDVMRNSINQKRSEMQSKSKFSNNSVATKSMSLITFPPLDVSYVKSKVFGFNQFDEANGDVFTGRSLPTERQVTKKKTHYKRDR